MWFFFIEILSPSKVHADTEEVRWVCWCRCRPEGILRSSTKLSDRPNSTHSPISLRSGGHLADNLVISRKITADDARSTYRAVRARSVSVSGMFISLNGLPVDVNSYKSNSKISIWVYVAKEAPCFNFVDLIYWILRFQ